VLKAHAAAVTVAGGNSTQIGGWQISPNPGIDLNITGVNSNHTLIIQSDSATFENNSPLSVSFTQLSADAVASVEFQDATIADSTAQDWTGFTYSLSGSAIFESVSNVFVPPLSTGVDYNIVALQSPTIVKYSGTQLSNAVSTWGGSSNDDDLVIATDPSTGPDFTTFILSQSPIVNEVRAPLAAWQSLTGLLLVAIFTVAIRPTRPVLLRA